MLKYIFLFLCCLAPYLIDAQVDFTREIKKEQLSMHLNVLAADSLEGRKTGEKGQQMAATYLINQLEQLGVKPLVTGYKQKFYLYDAHKSGTITLGKKQLNFPKDFGFNGTYGDVSLTGNFKLLNSLAEIKTTRTDSNDIIGVWVKSYKHVDLNAIPKNNAKAIFFLCKTYERAYFVDYGSQEINYPKPGGQIIVFINASNTRRTKHLLKQKTLEVKLSLKRKKIPTENVLAYIEGTDSLLKEEVVVLSAHYDHLGIINNEVYNGADDNGSGSAALLELARVFQEANKNGLGNKRSLVFAWFTGEELGLFGSKYYSEHPPVALKQTVANLNIDMIGRADPKHENAQYSVYLIGADRLSKELHQQSEAAAEAYTNLKLDYTYNRTDDKLQLYYRSDHYNFARYGIPSIFYFGGFHDDYHKSTDDIEQIDYEKIKEISTLVGHTAWKLLNAEKSLERKIIAPVIAE